MLRHIAEFQDGRGGVPALGLDRLALAQGLQEPDAAAVGRARGITRYYASRFVAHIEAWKQFCAELHMDSEAQLTFMIGWGLVTQTEKAARRLAFDAEEAAQFLRLETDPVADDAGLECGPVPVENVAELVRDWHTMLEEMVRHEGGE